MASDIEIRSCEGGELRIESRGVARVIRGYAIVFDRLSENLGGFREKIDPLAVDRTLKEGVDLRALVDHDTSKILGRLTAGTLRAEKDAQGLRVEIDPPDTTVAQDIVESIRRRDVTGMSFAFRTLADEWDFKGDPPIRTVTDMVIREVSIVTFPAYPQTDVAMRAFRAEQVKRVEPAAGESHQEFMDRCMGSDVMMGEFPDNKQRVAVCQSMWDKHKSLRPATISERLRWEAEKMRAKR